MTSGDLVAQVSAALADGDYLAAFDLAYVLPLSPVTIADAQLAYLRVLALVRAGSPDQARTELDAFELERLPLPPQLGEDVASLRARLTKDQALDRVGDEQAAAARAAAVAYEAVYDTYGRYYACINAATLWLLAGVDDRARALAARAADLARAAELDDSDDRYWSVVTRAEAALILDEEAEAARLLAAAATLRIDDFGARASTRRQLSLVCRFRGVDPSRLLVSLTNPEVLHYCGHMIAVAGSSGAFSPDDEQYVRDELDSWLAGRRVGTAYGSLACGTDILVVEALQQRGTDVHVRLPFDQAEFVETSVAPAGPDWVRRFHDCVARARTVQVTCDSSYLGDDGLFGFASRVAMGEAVNRARALASTVTQVAVWDGQPGPPVAGTSHDVAAWRSAGLDTHVIGLPSRPRPALATAPTQQANRRPVLAVLFGDLQGFSALHDEELFQFIDGPWAAIARALRVHGKAVLRRATWGDAIFLAAADVTTIARCALDIQDALAGTDMSAYGLPDSLRMRIAVHTGPVVWAHDPVLDEADVFGRELTRAARIEPRTPPGEVYATSAFAALLSLMPDSGIDPQYVGRVPTAKGFETLPMYILKRQPA